MNKRELLNAFKKDMRAAETHHSSVMSKIKGWRNTYDGALYGNEQDGKSKIVSKDTRKQSEWLHASIVDPFLSSSDIIKTNPVTFEDKEAARQNELLLNTQFCRQFNRYNFITKAMKVLDRDGTVVIKTSWESDSEEVEVEVPTIDTDEFGQEYISGITTATQVNVTKNQPDAKVCRNEDVFIDPTCQDDMDNCQFVIYRYESDLSTLQADGRYKNLDKIKKDNSSDPEQDDDYTTQDDSSFKFEDDPRKKLLVYEYWGNYDVNGDGIAEPIVCVWVNDTIIQLSGNPYPDKKPPFLIVPFNAVPFQLHGEANAELIGDNQKIKTAITRGIIDNMAQSNNGQVGVRKGALDAKNMKKFVNNQNFVFNGTPNDIWQGSYNSIPGSAFDMLAMQNNEIESITGQKGFSGGINAASLGGTATGARGALDSTATRRLNIVRNVAENMVKPLMRKWMAYNSEFLRDEEVIRITNEEFIEIRRDDISGNIDIDIEVSTAEDNAAKSQELSFLLQTLGPNEDPMIRRGIMADIYELMRMPDKAKLIRDYAPEPDPVQQQMQQIELERLQLENEKIRAEIADKYARAGENEVDRALKEAKVGGEIAKTRMLNSSADKADLDFIRIDEGMDHKEAMEKEEHKRLSNLDTMAFQAQQADKNIGVQR